MIIRSNEHTHASPLKPTTQTTPNKRLVTSNRRFIKSS